MYARVTMFVYFIDGARNPNLTSEWFEEFESRLALRVLAFSEQASTFRV